MKKIDVSIPRWMYWSDDVSSLPNCPKCGTPLVKERHAYLLMVKEEKDMESFVVGNDSGSFCPNCPVVVLEKEEFENSAIIGSDSSAGMFSVAGIVNLDAIHNEKQDIPIGTDDNPVPLVEFLNSGASVKQTPVESNKIGRNEPCPCGSGKKYKKCCYGKLLA
jgi:hypothetical protein